MSKKTADYIKHASIYGTDQVLEAAIDDGLAFNELCALLVALDKLPQYQPKPKFWAPAKHRLTVEQRVRRALGLDEPEPDAAA